WIALPTSLDGLAFRRLIGREDGPQLYAAWLLIAQVAAKCATRGVLRDTSGPLTAEDLALRTGAPAELFTKALQVLTSKEIGWLTRRSLRARSEHTRSPLG